MTPFNELIEKLHQGKNPYSGFPAVQWRGTWHDDPGAKREIFSKALDRAKPGIVIEVGSFVGESAIFMANHIKERNLDAAILCVDTWYAGFDHWQGARDKIQMHFGRPDLYYKFMANVIANGCQDVIVPLASDSLNAARVLKWIGIQADMIYVDASHEEGDVLRDYEAYWPLLKSGGVFLVDDLSNHFPGVLRDFDRFVKAHKLKVEMTEGEKSAIIRL